MPSPLTKHADGSLTWEPEPGDFYLVTGTTRAGKRFRFTSPHWNVAQAINAYRGNYWLCRAGRRYLIQTRVN